ncbi:unnamed protein product, partial [Musa hybrid cultivar]
ERAVDSSPAAERPPTSRRSRSATILEGPQGQGAGTSRSHHIVIKSTYQAYPSAGE